MKNKLFILFKNNLINTYQVKKTTPKKLILIIVVGLYILGSLIGSLYMFLKTMFDKLLTSGIADYFIPILMIIATIFSFFFTIFSAKSVLFDSKDNNLLLSLPIKRSTIFTSRLLVLIFMNFLINLLFMIPGLCIYIKNISCTIIFYIMIPIILILLPVIPTILASLFGYVVAKITALSKRKNIVEIICYILFIGIYLFFITKAKNLLFLLTDNVLLLNNIIKYIGYPIYLIEKFLVTNNIIYIGIYIIINLSLFTLFVLILSKKYFSIISRLSSHSKKGVYKEKQLISKSKREALNIKEIKRYFSSAIYVFNTAFGVIFFLIGSVASIFYKPDVLTKLVSTNIELDSYSLVLYFMLMVVGFTMTTNSSISIERNNFWILKMLPIETKDIFASKKHVNRLVTLPAVILGLIIFTISSYITPLQLLILVVICIIYNLFICNFGLICNLLFPKMDAINDTIIVKQSAASFVGIMVPLVFTIIIIGVLSTLNLSFQNMALIILAFVIVLWIISNRVLYTWGIKKFKEIA